MARQGLNRFSHRLGYWRTHGTDTAVAEAADREAAAGIERARAQQQIGRVAYQVIKAPSFSCHRVMRLYVKGGNTERELIGYGSLRDALAVSTTEEWRAQVIDPNGKIASDNWRPMERR